jgi:23S rRNA (cytidine1920-2'-O)/16S rRNA (cytidine1409-2'-O)-methyltransferase
VVKNKKPVKVRLDKLLVEQGMAPTRERAKALIMAGAVLVEGHPVDKAGTLIADDAVITVKGDDNPYVSRGGLKLKGALSEFGISVEGAVAFDVGVSTGGFTDCLLQEGARKVYAVDVGYGQLAWKLRRDERVVLFERTNIRYFSGDGIVDDIDIVTIDVSFISLKLVLPVVNGLVKEGCAILALIKPQFEAGKGEVGKKGVVRDPAIHAGVIEGIIDLCKSLNLAVHGVVESPITGPAGNREFFIYAKK